MQRVLKANAEFLSYTCDDILHKELVGMVPHPYAPGIQIKWGNDLC